MVGFTPAPIDGGNALTLSGDVSADALDWLPPQAAERLRNLRQRSTDLHGAIPPFEQRQEANAAKSECAQRLARLTGRRTELSGTGFGFELSPDDPRCVTEQKKLDSLTKAAERINGLYEQRSKDWTASSAALAHTESWLKQGRPGGTTLVDHAGEAPKMKNGETLPDAIARFRKKVTELQIELAGVENAPVPSSWCRQKARAQIEALAARGKPNVQALIAGDMDVIQFASERHSHNLIGFDVKGKPVTGIAAWEAPDLLGLFCHVHKAAIIAAVDAAIGAEADDAKALAPEVRETTLADIRVKLLDAERAECSLVWAALEAKLPTEFRGDADPRAVLRVELVAAPATAAAASISDHAFDLVGIFGGRT